MRLTIICFAAAIITVPAATVFAQDRSACASNKDTYQAIKSCSDLIRVNPKDAAAFHLRGNAMARNGDVGQAIADYSKAIQINPSYGPAYDSRASAYTNKGDYTRALPDATKAAELAKMKQEPKTSSIISKEPAKVMPKTSTAAPAKQPSGKQEAATFNPFADRSTY